MRASPHRRPRHPSRSSSTPVGSAASTGTRDRGRRRSSVSLTDRTSSPSGTSRCPRSPTPCSTSCQERTRNGLTAAPASVGSTPTTTATRSAGGRPPGPGDGARLVSAVRPTGGGRYAVAGLTRGRAAVRGRRVACSRLTRDSATNRVRSRYLAPQPARCEVLALSQPAEPPSCSAAYTLHATHDPRVTTQPARDAFLARFEREVDRTAPSPSRSGTGVPKQRRRRTSAGWPKSRLGARPSRRVTAIRRGPPGSGGGVLLEPARQPWMLRSAPASRARSNR